MHPTNAACMIRVLDRTNPRMGPDSMHCRLTQRCMPHSGTSIRMDKYLQIYVAPPKVDSSKGPKPVRDHGSMCDVRDHDSICFVETLSGWRAQGCLFFLPEFSVGGVGGEREGRPLTTDRRAGDRARQSVNTFLSGMCNMYTRSGWHAQGCFLWVVVGVVGASPDN